ncbi:MAG: hypothetical protein DRH17_13285 [Deltaproteobacteria bacterium]|nr:MAG: hypothetical protein DRH17_13285 [Deltaproteobacteria bacterium]
MQICIDVPKWIFAEVDQNQFLYEISRMIRETISTLTERPRTNPEKVVRRAVTRLVIARIAVETLIAVKKDIDREIAMEVINELNEAMKRIEEKVRTR